MQISAEIESAQPPDPLVSVVNASFNMAEYLPFAIESALHQTYGRVEIVVVDDGSTDDTASVMQRYRNEAKVIIQHYFLQSSYLFNRKAILFIPPFALMLGSAFAFLQDRTKNLVSITVLLVLTWHLGRTMNTSFCREWWYDANTKTLMLELERISQQNSDTITLGTNWLFMPTAEFYRVTRQMSRIAPLVYDKAIQADGRFDYYYIDYPDWPLLQNNYQKINGVCFAITHAGA